MGRSRTEVEVFKEQAADVLLILKASLGAAVEPGCS
jgi:hypothetical protein